MSGKVVSESSGNFGSGIVESEGKFKLLVWVGSHGCSLCRGTVIDRVVDSLVLCYVLDRTSYGDTTGVRNLWVRGSMWAMGTRGQGNSR